MTVLAPSGGLVQTMQAFLMQQGGKAINQRDRDFPADLCINRETGSRKPDGNLSERAEIGLNQRSGGSFDRADEAAGQDDLPCFDPLAILFHAPGQPDQGSGPAA